MIALAAIIGSLMCAASLIMQIGLALGAPWGEYANGGKFPGVLPMPMRFAAVVQGSILVFIALTLLEAAGLTNLGFAKWTIWVALGICLLTCILNWVTLSKKERRLWGRTTTILLLSALIVFLAPIGHANSTTLGEYACPDAGIFDVYASNGKVRGATLHKLSGGNIALYPLAPPKDIMRLEWANLFGAGYRAGDLYFFESSEGRHELVHTPTNTRVDCLPNPASPRAIQKRPAG
ncbi:MAG: hypothetical protein AAFY99_11605 [Pseudomonadota bacterium]